MEGNLERAARALLPLDCRRPEALGRRRRELVDSCQRRRQSAEVRMRFFRRRDPNDELAEEIRSHLEMRSEWNRQSGMAADEARSAAQKQFGNAGIVYEETRRMHV